MELRAVTQLLYSRILVEADGLTAHLNDTCFCVGAYSRKTYNRKKQLTFLVRRKSIIHGRLFIDDHGDPLLQTGLQRAATRC